MKTFNVCVLLVVVRPRTASSDLRLVVTAVLVQTGKTLSFNTKNCKPNLLPENVGLAENVSKSYY